MSIWPDFSVPADWRVIESRQAATVMKSGGTPSRKEERYWNGDIPFVLIEDMTSAGLYLDRTKERITQAGLDESSAWIVPSGNVLLSMYATIGASVVNRIPVATNQAILAIVPKKDVSPEFLAFCLRAHKRALSARNVQSTQKNINKGIVETFPLPLPPLAEQRKIAGVLGVVQRAIEQQERLLQLTAVLKKTLLHQLFTHGLRGEPRKQTEVGPVPESWEQRPLEEAGEVVYGIQAAVASNLDPIGTKILTNKNITLDGRIDLEAINYFALKTPRHHATVLRKGDLLFNWRSGSKEHVGKTAYFDLDGEYTHSSFILRIRTNDAVSGRYLFYYLNFLRETGYFVKSQTYAVNAKFNKSAINRLPTYLPGKGERQEIVTALDAVGTKLDALQVKRKLLEEIFRTLLHQLMTAQIRVHDLDLPELEVATVS
jgi:type I restriction enzyme, S subunit